MSEEVQIVAKSIDKSKKTKLILSILFDLIGALSYLVPVFAEITDIIWAPISGFILFYMYKGTVGKIAGIIGFIEEALPFVDFIPTFTLTWIYEYKIKKQE